MKKVILFLIVSSLSFSMHAQKVFMAESVIQNAKWMKVNYKKTMKKAAKNDETAIVTLANLFSGLEGKDNALHARSCVELMHIVGDTAFSFHILKMEPKYRKVMVKYLPQGHALVEKPALKQPLDTLFPISWQLLQGNVANFQAANCSDCRLDAMSKEMVGRTPEEKAKISEKNAANRKKIPMTDIEMFKRMDDLNKDEKKKDKE